jgi:hypothetical protein
MWWRTERGDKIRRQGFRRKICDKISRLGFRGKDFALRFCNLGQLSAAVLSPRQNSHP